MTSNESLGRTVLIAVIAGVLFAGFLALTPRLTASQQAEPVGPAEVVEIDVAAPSISEPVVAVTDPAFDGFDAPPPVVEERFDPPVVECPEAEPCECECECDCDDNGDDNGWHDEDDNGWHDDDDNGWHDDNGHDNGHENGHETVYDGRLGILVELLGPGAGKESVILSEGDFATWNFWVSNDGDEKLWGVYLYLEGYGPVECDSSRLEAGDSTFCTASDRVWGGNQTAEIWATAWTTEIQVGAETFFDYWVAH